YDAAHIDGRNRLVTLEASVRDMETAQARGALGIVAGDLRMGRPEARAAWMQFLRGGEPKDMMAFARPQAAASTQVGPNTGWLVPEEVAADIEKLQRDFSPLRRLARVYTAKTDVVEFLIKDRSATSGWVGE